ncbi:MAG TPA: DUF779 domain-containing protein [Solirubrobacter sp.]
MPVTATPAALDVIWRLTAAHGPLVLFQSGGCCDGSSPICLKAGELPLTPSDIQLGNIGTTPFLIDAEQFERWGSPDFVVDAAPGPPEGLSLGLADVHLVTRAAS